MHTGEVVAGALRGGLHQVRAQAGYQRGAPVSRVLVSWVEASLGENIIYASAAGTALGVSTATARAIITARSRVPSAPAQPRAARAPAQPRVASGVATARVASGQAQARQASIAAQPRS